MKVILIEDVPNLGKIGDITTVADGFGRNYLLPKQFAISADKKNLKRFEHQKRLVEIKKAKHRKEAQSLKDRLESTSFTIPCKVGEQNKLYGSVTSQDIEKIIHNEGITEISRRDIILEQPIKEIGIYNVDIKVHAEVSTKIKLYVTPDSREKVAELEMNSSDENTDANNNDEDSNSDGNHNDPAL